jgi:hypothetical protein
MRGGPWRKARAAKVLRAALCIDACQKMDPVSGKSRATQRRHAARALYRELRRGGPRPIRAAELVTAADLVRARLAQVSDDGERVVITAAPTPEGGLERVP